MRPVDPRLQRYAHAVRGYLATAVAIGAATAVVVVAQAWLVALLVDAGFVRREGADRLEVPLAALAAVLVVRAALLWATEWAAQRSSARAKSELRLRLLRRSVELGPAATGGPATAEVTTLATRGVDALDAYFARYLPQLVLSVVVPVTVVVALLANDLLAALVVGLTVPLVPVFMALVGAGTRGRTQRQLAAMQRLSGHFLDVVAGLPTLKVFGRARGQARAIREGTEAYRVATMGVLRLTFLSALVLELVAMLSVALVAVSVGLRVVGGELDFRTALFVLVLAPEAYLPMRALGASYHASAEGMAAVDRVFAVLETEPPVRGTRSEVPDPARAELELAGVQVTYPGRGEPVLDGVSLRVEPGTTVVLTGPSGAGKSTLLAILLGFVRPTAGTVRVGGVDLAELDPDAWRGQVAWVPQRPYLFAGTLADNVRLGRPEASDAAVDEAIAEAGLAGVVAALPDGLDTRLGDRGVGLSAGERQRLALARAFVRDAPLLLLDEPTAALDGATEGEVVEAVARLARGRTVLLVAHRPTLAALGDRVVRLDPPTRPTDRATVAAVAST